LIQVTSFSAAYRHSDLRGQKNNLADDVRLSNTFGQVQLVESTPAGPQ
jgi:hypothetical protein